MKSAYQHHKMISGAQGLKIIAQQDISGVVGGSSIFIVPPKTSNRAKEEIKKQAMKDLEDLHSKLAKTGVYVQTSSLGSLEALLALLSKSGIPVFAGNFLDLDGDFE